MKGTQSSLRGGSVDRLHFFSSSGHSSERINMIYPSISGLVLELWVTKDAGLFDKHGLDVSLIYIQSASAVMQAMLGGQAPIVLAGGSAGRLIRGWKAAMRFLSEALGLSQRFMSWPRRKFAPSRI